MTTMRVFWNSVNVYSGGTLKNFAKDTKVATNVKFAEG